MHYRWRLDLYAELRNLVDVLRPSELSQGGYREDTEIWPIIVAGALFVAQAPFGTAAMS